MRWKPRLIEGGRSMANRPCATNDDQDSAFAAAVVWRICTFYIPAGIGFFASKWLENGEYV